MPDKVPKTGEDAAARSLGRFTSWCLRADPRPLLVLALVVMLVYLWRYRCPALAMVARAYYEDFCFGLFLFAVVAAGRAVQRLLRNSCEARFGLQTGAFRSPRWFWSWLLLIGAGTLFLIQSQLPMHISFLVSRAALDAIADEALAHP